jgi:hypothetical protein
MKPIIVVEGKADRAILEAILGSEAENVELREASGLSAADSLARSLLVTGAQKVALVVDADSRDPNWVEDRKRFYDNSLRQVAPKARSLVVVVEPQVEGLLLAGRNSLPAFLQSISDTDLVAAYYDAKGVLSKYLEGAPIESLVQKISDEDRARLQELPEIRRLREFLQPSNSEKHKLSVM